MATVKLLASTYSVSNTTVTVQNPNNMYTNTNSTNYATITHTTSSTSSFYCYIKGFNFSEIPSNAEVSSIVIRIKGRESGISTSASYAPSLCNNTGVIAGTTASTNFGTTSSGTLITVPYTGTWDTLKGYGANLGIRVTVRRSRSNTQGYLYIYGAEIEVEYIVPNPRTITTELTGNGTIAPSGSTTSYDDENFTVTITPTNKSDTVTVTNNNVDVTSNLVTHYVPGQTTTNNRVLGTYTLVSGGFNGSGASYFSGLTGKGHTSSTTTSNYYSSGSSTIAVFTYDISFTLPAGAVVTNLYVMVSGHAESTSSSSEYMCAQIISGNDELSEELNFKDIGTSNSTQTITAHTMPTVEQAANLKLRCRLGYYGGALNGATCYIEYEIPTSEIDHYTYTFEVDGDATIKVNIGSTITQTIYYKNNGTWIAAVSVYKKINGSWVQQTDLSNVFDPNTNYVKG